MPLSDEQMSYYDTFGYLLLPGLLREEIGWITEVFDAVVEGNETQFLERDERLLRLLEHGPISQAAGQLLGAEWGYVGSGATVHGEHEVAWHNDSFIRAPGFLRVMIYLDPLEAGAGALHVIPGAHRRELRSQLSDPAGVPWDARARWGVDARAVPGVGLPVAPGDVILFDLNMPHASFGGGRRRRKIDLTLSARCQTQEQRDCLRHILETAIERRRDRVFRAETVASASPARLARLAQAHAIQPLISALARRETREAIHPRVRALLAREAAAGATATASAAGG